MTDYKKMYLTLFHATEEVMDLLSLLPPPLPEAELRRKVKRLLTEAQQRRKGAALRLLPCFAACRVGTPYELYFRFSHFASQRPPTIMAR